MPALLAHYNPDNHWPLSTSISQFYFTYDIADVTFNRVECEKNRTILTIEKKHKLIDMFLKCAETECTVYKLIKKKKKHIHKKPKLDEYDTQFDSSSRDQKQQVSSYEDADNPSFYGNACIWSMCVQKILFYHEH